MKYVDDIIKRFKREGYFLPEFKTESSGEKCIRLMKLSSISTDVLEIFEIEDCSAANVTIYLKDDFEYDIYKNYILNDKVNSINRIIVCNNIDKYEKEDILNKIDSSCKDKKLSLILVVPNRAEIIYDDSKLNIDDNVLRILTDSINKYTMGIYYYTTKLAKIINYISISIFIKYVLMAMLILLFILLTVFDFIMVDSEVAPEIFIDVTLGLGMAFFGAIFVPDLGKLRESRFVELLKLTFFLCFFVGGIIHASISSIDIFKAPISKVVLIEDYVFKYGHGSTSIEYVSVRCGDRHYVLYPSKGKMMSKGDIYKVKIYPNVEIIKQDGKCSVNDYNHFVDEYGFKGMSMDKVSKLLGKPFKSETFNGKQGYLYYYWGDDVAIVFVFDENECVEKCNAFEYKVFNLK